MKIETYIPTALLRPYIKTYRVIESEKELVNRVLPDTSLALAFRYKGNVNYLEPNGVLRLPKMVLSGLRKSARLINYLENSATIIVLFKETGAKAFFREPLQAFFQESVALDNFINHHKLSGVEEQLAEAATNTHRIAIVEGFLLSILCNQKEDRLVYSAIQKIYSAKGIVRMKELANAHYISQDAFEKRFRRVVGTTPKQFSNIVRIKSLISLRKQDQALADMAFEAGYFDQPHFNKNFKLFTGQSPSDFFKSDSFW